VNLPGNNIDATNKNLEFLIDAIKEVSREVNAEKTKHEVCLVTRRQGKIMTERQLTDPSKMWHRSDIWERQ
jgi:hypothetical protein